MKNYIQEKSTRQCQGCKIALPYKEGLEYYGIIAYGRYGVASPECLALLDELLMKEFTFDRPMLARFDAYGVQHPPHFEIQKKLGVSERLILASSQSVAVHLIALYLMLEKKVEIHSVSAIMARILSSGVALEKEELEPPAHLGAITVLDVLKATTRDEHIRLVWEWSRSTWNAWAEYHSKVQLWYEKYAK
jgi:hypothetical protein